jgi:hypothetical protein
MRDSFGLVQRGGWGYWGRPSSVDDLLADQAASIPESGQTDQLLLPLDRPDP